MSFRLALALAGLSGLIALVYEILWARIYGFVSASRAVAFGSMLGSYLFGLAIGSLLSRRWQDQSTDRQTTLRSLSRLIILSNLVAFLVVPAISWRVVVTHWATTLPFVTFGAMLLGTLLPLLCHASIEADPNAGARMSRVYVSNIIGSGVGSMLTGFFLLERFAVWQIAAGLLVLATLCGIALAKSAGPITRADYFLWGLAGAFAVSSPFLHSGLYERLQLRTEYESGTRFANVVESRHGIITVDAGRTIYGGGIYDGMIDVRPKSGGGLFRPLFISAVHPAPRNILVIGISGGAWTQILANHPQVEHVTAVEIDAGYLKIIRAYPNVAGILSNPKVEIVIDDGRRWLRRNADRRFDVIVMNTTFNWREFASALLGREFLELVRSHLGVGGVVLWNCTGSGRAIATGMAVFPHTMMIANNCLASDSPLVIDRARWRDILASYQIEGAPLFDLTTTAGKKDLDEMVTFADPANPSGLLTLRPAMQAAFGSNSIITDDNLGEEYGFKFAGHPFFGRFFSR